MEWLKKQQDCLCSKYGKRCPLAMQYKLNKNSLGHYKTSQHYMMQYIAQEDKAKDIALSTLDFSFLVGFEGYLRSYTLKIGQSKFVNNTARKHIKRLRTMVKLAYQMEWIQRDQFVNSKIKLDKSERAFLTKSELDIVESLSSSIERLDIV